MSDFPKWLLGLAFISIVPVLVSPFYLFAAPDFVNRQSGVGGLLLYVLVQLLWIVPLVLFFVSLDQYRRGFTRRGVAIASASAAVALGGLLFILLA